MALMTEQAQQVPGQPLTGIQVAASRKRFDLAEQHLVQSLQGLVLHWALRVHHRRHHTLQPRLLHHMALWFSLVIREGDRKTVYCKMNNTFFPFFLVTRLFGQVINSQMQQEKDQTFSMSISHCLSIKWQPYECLFENIFLCSPVSVTSSWWRRTVSSSPTHWRAFFFTDTAGSLQRSDSVAKFSMLMGITSCLRRLTRACVGMAERGG